jgi:hypothetical protein
MTKSDQVFGEEADDQAQAGPRVRPAPAARARAAGAEGGRERREGRRGGGRSWQQNFG